MEFHPLQQAHATHLLYKDMLRFIEQGLTDWTGRKLETGLALLSGQLAASVADSLRLLPSKPVAFTQPVLSAGVERHYIKYLRWLKRSFIAWRAEDVSGLAFIASLDNAEQLISEELGPAVPLSLDEQDPVRKAFQIAAQNRQLTQARLGVLHFLLEEARTYRPISPALDVELADAMTTLNANHTQFTLSWLMFATLIGGETLAQSRQSLVSERLGEDCSIMGYLEMGERLPGQWLSADEESFRAAVQAHRGQELIE